VTLLPSRRAVEGLRFFAVLCTGLTLRHSTPERVLCGNLRLPCANLLKVKRAGGPPSTTLVDIILTKGAPSLRSLQGWVQTDPLVVHDDTVSPWVDQFTFGALFTGNFWEHGFVDLIGGTFFIGAFPQ